MLVNRGMTTEAAIADSARLPPGLGKLVRATYSDRHVDTINSIYQKHEPIEFSAPRDELTEAEAGLSPTVAIRFRQIALHPGEGTWAYRVEWRGEQITLYLSSALPETMVSAVFPEVTLEALKSESVALLFDYCASTFIETLLEGEARPTELVRLGIADDRLLHPGITGTLEAGDKELGTFSLHAAEEATFRKLIKSVTRLVSVSRNYDGLVARATLFIGHAYLSVEELAGLEKFDVILAESCLLADDKAMLKFEGEFGGLLMQIKDNRLITQQIIEENTMPEATDRPIDTIKLDVSFELGSLKLPVSKLATITEGHVFKLGRALDMTVTVKANGVSLGKGDIVYVDDKIGVQMKQVVEMTG